MADEYHKIAGPFKRSAEDIKKVDRSLWVDPTVQALADSDIWTATEKIDGTNIRVVWDGHNFAIEGRTDRAQLHGHLIEKIASYFNASGVEEEVEEMFGEKEVIFVGEGYGAGIQSGAHYSPNKEFVGYDIRVNGSWLSQDNVEDVYDKLSIPVLRPVTIGAVSLDYIVAAVSRGLWSRLAYTNTGADVMAEGVVARPVVPLYDQRGKRIIVKVKTVDLYEEADF